MPDFCNVSLPIDNRESAIVTIEVDNIPAEEVHTEYQVECSFYFLHILFIFSLFLLKKKQIFVNY